MNSVFADSCEEVKVSVRGFENAFPGDSQHSRKGAQKFWKYQYSCSCYFYASHLQNITTVHFDQLTKLFTKTFLTRQNGNITVRLGAVKISLLIFK